MTFRFVYGQLVEGFITFTSLDVMEYSFYDVLMDALTQKYGIPTVIEDNEKYFDGTHDSVSWETETTYLELHRSIWPENLDISLYYCGSSDTIDKLSNEYSGFDSI